MVARGLNKTTCRCASCRSTAGPAGAVGAAVIEFDASGLDSASLRRAGKELLSLALIDARNHTLRWATRARGGGRRRALALPATCRRRSPPSSIRRSGRSATSAGSRSTGSAATCSAAAARAPIRRTRAWPRSCPTPTPGTTRRSSTGARRRDLAGGELPDLQATRDLPGRVARDDARAARRLAVEDDASLYFHRLALFHEEMHVEAFAVLAQTLGIDDSRRPAAAHRRPAPRGRRCSFRRRAGCSARAAPAFASTTRPSRIRSRCPSSRSTPRRSPGRSTASSSRTAATTNGSTGARPAGTGCSAKDGARRATSTRCATACCSAASACSPASPRRIPRCTSAGTRPMPGAAGPGDACRAKSSGKRRRTRARRAAFVGATCTSGPATTFRPYPGFVPGPWRDYSLPAFGSHKVLRGASFATRPACAARACAASSRPSATTASSASAAAPQARWRGAPH